MATAAAVAAAAAREAIEKQRNRLEVDIRTEDEMLEAGLGMLGYSKKQIFEKVQRETSNERFRIHYGANPKVIAFLWNHLQTTPNVEAKISKGDRKMKYFLMTLHFMKRYPTEGESESMFRMSDWAVRKYKWLYIDKISALVVDLIKWPADNYGDDIWMLSLDGTQIRSQETTDENYPKDEKMFCHKHHCAGYNYEIGLSLWESKLIWFRGPYKAGANPDLTIFVEGGLKDKLGALGKRAIADGGYAGYPNHLTTPNSHDEPEVAHFKRRAQQRHERYNGMIKEFKCLSNDSRWRHDVEKLCKTFEAIVCIVQLKMQMKEEVLFDI